MIHHFGSFYCVATKVGGSVISVADNELVMLVMDYTRTIEDRVVKYVTNYRMIDFSALKAELLHLHWSKAEVFNSIRAVCFFKNCMERIGTLCRWRGPNSSDSFWKEFRYVSVLAVVREDFL
jgi:hypothetical protein